MLKVAITGGIGSGKSLVCQVFKTLGIPIFDADAVSNHLVEHDATLKTAITELFGKEAYKNNIYNRKYIASIVFSQAEMLQALNALVHPKAIEAAKQWFEKQQTPFSKFDMMSIVLLGKWIKRCHLPGLSNGTF